MVSKMEDFVLSARLQLVFTQAAQVRIDLTSSVVRTVLSASSTKVSVTSARPRFD